MSLRNLAPLTQQAYIRGWKRLAAFLRRSPDTATGEDIRLFQLHLAKQGPPGRATARFGPFPALARLRARYGVPRPHAKVGSRSDSFSSAAEPATAAHRPLRGSSAQAQSTATHDPFQV
jgi:Phage integrase, N-terminal SAM-like domain